MDYSTLFPDMPDDARLWIHITNRPLTDEEQRALTNRIRQFAEGWTSHNRPVRGAVEMVDDRVLLIAATIDEGPAISGCGIDAVTHAVEEAAQALKFDWASPLDVFYRDDDGRLQQCSRSEFRTRIENEGLTTETIVLDPSVMNVGELREGAVEQPARSAWHARVFDLPEPA